MVMRVSDELLRALYDGVCTVYESVPVEGGFGWASKRERRAVYSELPCHLAFERTDVADGGVVSEIKASGVLFLGVEPEISPGSEVIVRQGGREYRMALCGLPRVYAVHQEVRVALLDELA